MKCPICGSPATIPGPAKEQLYEAVRTRSCVDGHKFVTHEVVRALVCPESRRKAAIEIMERRIKRFSRNKLIRGELAAGKTVPEASQKFGLTPVRITQIMRSSR